MKIQWLGHAAFVLTAADGTRVLTDPYEPGCFEGAVCYAPITGQFDAVTVSHEHADHNWTKGLAGNPRVIKGTGEFSAGGFSIAGFDSWHDSEHGRLRGPNTIFVFDDGEVRVCHLGDLGHELDAATVNRLGRVDVLLVPVGGTFTIDAGAAHRVSEQLGARMIVPMHFKTDKLGFDIAGVDPFIDGRENARRAGSNELEVVPEMLPVEPEIVVLEPAL
ncbi:MBL fold metallo-hydrolase [candidate division WOR-3 bacterium]|nr:MBL fold metallo-hydrolase [candidate division WOR-3 bacterium]